MLVGMDRRPQARAPAADVHDSAGPGSDQPVLRINLQNHTCWDRRYKLAGRWAVHGVETTRLR